MVRFTFTSGKEVEYDYEWIKLAPKLQLGGLRLFAPMPGVLIPLNSHTIAVIEDLTLVEPEVIEVDYREEKEDAPVEPPKVEPPKLDTQADNTEEHLSIEQKKEKILAEMKELSACLHEQHDIYYQNIQAGPRRNRRIDKRYFPVCVKCGVRERYVKADSLTEEQKANAKVWDK